MLHNAINAIHVCLQEKKLGQKKGYQTFSCIKLYNIIFIIINQTISTDEWYQAHGSALHSSWPDRAMYMEDEGVLVYRCLLCILSWLLKVQYDLSEDAVNTGEQIAELMKLKAGTCVYHIWNKQHVPHIQTHAQLV